MPSSSSTFSVPCTVSRRGGVAELVRHEDAPVPVVLAVALRVDLDEDRGRLDVAVLVADPEVELEMAPVGRERIDDRLEVLGKATRAAYSHKRPAARHLR